MTTKWDLISEDEREGFRNTPCNLNCTGCGELLATEADFAAHFVLADIRYKNLGECPRTEKGKRLLSGS